MKAAYIEHTARRSYYLRRLAKPSPVGAEVLIKVRAVSVNPVDTYIRNGAQYWELPKPFIVGCDVAGTIEEVGPQVKHFRVGEAWVHQSGPAGEPGYVCGVLRCRRELGESDSGGDD